MERAIGPGNLKNPTELYEEELKIKMYKTSTLYLEQIRWAGQPQCPYWTSKNSTALKNEGRYHCNQCFTSYSVTVGTLFHKTHVELSKWFEAITIVLTASKKVSARQLAQKIDVNKNTAATMLSRIHQAAIDDPEFLQALITGEET